MTNPCGTLPPGDFPGGVPKDRLMDPVTLIFCDQAVCHIASCGLLGRGTKGLVNGSSNTNFYLGYGVLKDANNALLFEFKC